MTKSRCYGQCVNCN